MSELPKPPIATAFVLCVALGGCYERGREAIMPVIQSDGTVMNCPVDIDCAQGRTYRNQVAGCINYFKCKDPFEESDLETDTNK